MADKRCKCCTYIKNLEIQIQLNMTARLYTRGLLQREAALLHVHLACTMCTDFSSKACTWCLTSVISEIKGQKLLLQLLNSPVVSRAQSLRKGNTQIPTEGYLNFLVNYASTSSPSPCFQESPVHGQRSQSCEPVNKPPSSRCGPLTTRP